MSNPVPWMDYPSDEGRKMSVYVKKCGCVNYWCWKCAGKFGNRWKK